MVVAGADRWIAFADIASLSVSKPEAMIDMVWSLAEVVLHDGTALRGYAHTRYPLASSTFGDERDRILSGRVTRWQETGRTLVVGSGLKTWMTSHGDRGIFEFGACRLGQEVVVRA